MLRLRELQRRTFRNAFTVGAGSRRSYHQTARVQGINRHVGLVACVNRGGKLGLAFGVQRETAGKKNQHFASRHGAKIFCQAANGHEHGARAKISFRVA